MCSAPPRIGITLPVLAVMVCNLAFGLGRALAQPQPPKPVLFPIPASVVLERHLVGGPEDANVAGSSGERLVYSNTLGAFPAALGAGNLVADDIATTVPDGCQLRRYEFPVVGKVDPAGIGGPYTVNFALYSSCPGSVPSASRPALVIPGTQGQAVFLNDAPRLISFVAAANVTLPTNFWFGIRFSRNNAGVIVGAPAMKGFSADSFDYPGFPCNADFGGFPDQPHASFNVEIYADATCPEVFIGYKNNKPSGSLFNPGADVTFADDIQLGVDGCQMVAYEVAAKGVAFYTFDMRPGCEGPAIPGTEKFFTIGSGTDVKIARFTIDPPVPLPQNLWLSAKVNNVNGSVVVAGVQAAIGQTADVIGVIGGEGCILTDVPGTDVHAALNVSITCAGAPPVGACCDMAILDEIGDAVCREVPQMNCPWPPRFSALQPAWVPGAACDADPFPYPCGIAACCSLDNSNRFTCENLTGNQCDAFPSQYGVHSWQRGRYCGTGGQICPAVPAVCGQTTEDCRAAHRTPGCSDESCCTKVCLTAPDGAYCCSTEWDDVCAFLAREFCRCPANGRIDVDGDGDSDLNDYAGFPGCMAGPNLSVDPNCLVYDLDRDADIDLFDYSLLQIGLGCPASK